MRCLISRPQSGSFATTASATQHTPGIGRALALCQNWSDGIRTRRPMLHRLIVIAVTLLSGFAGGQAAAQAQESIGAVSRIQGEASGTRSGATRAFGLNASVFLNEVVSTGEAARLEVTFTVRLRCAAVTFVGCMELKVARRPVS